MRPLSVAAFLEFDEIPTKVTSESVLVVKRNTYSVHPRLVGEQVRVRIYEMRLEVWHSGQLVLEMPRLIGRNCHHIDYRHVVDAMLRKPGAFRCFKFKEDLFLSPVWHRAMSALQKAVGDYKADVDYLRLLHLASKNLEADVEAALSLLMEAGQCPSPDAAWALVKTDPFLPAKSRPPVKQDLSSLPRG